MNWIAAIGTSFLFGCGFYLLMKSGLIHRVFGLLLISHGVNFVLMCMARLDPNPAPPLFHHLSSGPMANPLPQALILTALVIGFAVAAFLWGLVLRLGREVK